MKTPFLVVLLALSFNAEAAEPCKPLSLTAELKQHSESTKSVNDKYKFITHDIQFGNFHLQPVSSEPNLIEFLKALAVKRGLAKSEEEVTLGQLKQLTAQPLDFGALKDLKMPKIGKDKALQLVTLQNCGLVLNLDFMDGRTETNDGIRQGLYESFFVNAVAKPAVTLKIDFRTYHKVVSTYPEVSQPLADSMLASDPDLGLQINDAQILVSNDHLSAPARLGQAKGEWKAAEADTSSAE